MADDACDRMRRLLKKLQLYQIKSKERKKRKQTLKCHQATVWDIPLSQRVLVPKIRSRILLRNKNCIYIVGYRNLQFGTEISRQLADRIDRTPSFWKRTQSIHGKMMDKTETEVVCARVKNTSGHVGEDRWTAERAAARSPSHCRSTRICKIVCFPLANVEERSFTRKLRKPSATTEIANSAPCRTCHTGLIDHQNNF